MLNQDDCKSAKLIVCVLTRGRSKTVLENLQALKPILASEYISIRSQNGSMGIHEWDEMDSLRVTVAAHHADSVFEILYRMVEIESCEDAYLFQIDVPKITHFELPDIAEEGVAISSLQDHETLPEHMDEETAKVLRALADID